MKLNQKKYQMIPKFTHNLAQISQHLAKKYGKAVFGVTLNLAIIGVISALPALAQQMPNPFGGSGTTKLANAGSNIMTIGTWLAFFIGLLSFVLIPIFIKFGWDYKKLLLSGSTGIGGFIILGAIAYDIVNLSGVTISDPTMGN